MYSSLVFIADAAVSTYAEPAFSSFQVWEVIRLLDASTALALALLSNTRRARELGPGAPARMCIVQEATSRPSRQEAPQEGDANVRESWATVIPRVGSSWKVLDCYVHSMRGTFVLRHPQILTHRNGLSLSPEADMSVLHIANT